MVPILLDGDRVVHDSWNIACYLEDRFPDAQSDRSDGLKLTLRDGWIHVRASNTEPLLRLAAEARSQDQVDELYERVETLRIAISVGVNE